MAGKREARKEDLKNRLFEAARARIIAGGVAGLRARDITAEAGCSLGALYTAYDDLDELVLRVNAETLARLGGSLKTAAAAGDDPAERLIGLGLDYLGFARSNMALWSSVFDHRMQGDRKLPQWYLEEQKVLFEHIGAPLLALHPQMDPGLLSVRVRTLFAAVHGIVSVGLREPAIGLPEHRIADELRSIIALMVKGSL